LLAHGPASWIQRFASGRGRGDVPGGGEGGGGGIGVDRSSPIPLRSWMTDDKKRTESVLRELPAVGIMTRVSSRPQMGHSRGTEMAKVRA
jgi:hypothetical protein